MNRICFLSQDTRPLWPLCCRGSAILIALAFMSATSVADTTIFSADFESTSSQNVWTTDPNGNDTATTGLWVTGIQPPYAFDSTQVQLAPYAGSNLVTGTGPNNANVDGDVDSGDTTARSVTFAVPASVDLVEANFFYYFGYRSGDASDYFRLSLYDSTTNLSVQTLVENTLSGTVSKNASWTSVTADITALGGTSVYFVVEVADAGSGGIIEAALDNVTVISRDRIEGQVRYDVDGDGDLANASGVDRGGNGVTVQLFADNGSGSPIGAALGTIVTGADGEFSFAGPAAGDYVILATDGTGTSSTADSDGANDNKILVTYAGSGINNGHLFLDTINYSGGTASLASYYLPYREDHILTSLATIYDESSCGGGVPESISPIQSYNSISIAFDDTIIFYDHYEDNTISGYETDVRTPTQKETEIWGDGILLNGVAPGDTDDILNSGEVIILSDFVDTGTLGSEVVYGGRDKFSSSKYVAATRASWGSGTNTLLAGAWELFATSRWGKRYVVPVGRTTASDSIFEYVGGSVMASQNDTDVFLNGAFVTNLDEGEEYFVNGGTTAGYLAGDVITADKDVQMHLITGNICATYESRWYTLSPSEDWASSYISPVSSASGSGTTVWLFSETSTTVTRTVRTGGSLVTSTIPLTAGVPVENVIPDGSAAQYETASDVFYAMVAVDADTTENSTHDWGHSLIPETQLSVLAVAGLAPGDDPAYAGGAPENSAPLWATAVYPQDSTSSGNITVYVDYNGDGNTQPTGGGTDANTGLDYDVSYSIAELERLKIYTDADGNGTADIADQTGTKVWTSGSDALIAIAYGQDPNTAAAGSPAVDLGTTVPGIPLLLASIGCTIVNDLNGNGLVDLGDTVDYEINVENAGAGPIAPNTVTVVNTPASEITYVTGSSTLDDGTLINVADDSVGTPSPVDEGGYTYNNQLNPSNQFTLRFEAIVTDIPSNGTITNVVDVIGLTSTISALHTFNYNPSPEVDIVTTAGSTPDGDIHKITSAGNVTYTYTITNEGLSHLADLVITDDNGTPGNPADDITLTATECPDLAGPIAPNATIVCTNTRLISADTTNTASVTGNPVNAVGDDLAGVANPTDSDPADVAIVGSISDLVWNDTNGNGIKDPGESGINGVTVNLRDPADNSIIDTVTTSGGGLYSFTQLVTGNYIVEFVPPTNYLFSPQSASGSTSANDSDPDTSTGRVTVSLASGQNTDEIDAGVYLPVSISNFVWDDRDADGIQDGGEPGLDGVTVRLYTPGLSEITSTTTAGGGLYSFTGLVAGSYVIHVDTPSGWLHSPANTTTDSVDSDPNPSTGNTTTYVLSAGDSDDTVDAGLYNPGSISDLVWVDTNGNGIQDSGESGLNGVTVNLLDPNNSDAVLDTTTTAGGGLYSFTGLVAGTYAIQFVLPNGYSFSPQTATGGTSATDSDPDPSTGRTSNIVLSAGENNDEIDAGIFLSGSIGNLVWNDIDADGIKDVGESGLDGVTVNLRDPDNSNALLATTVTAGGGAYLFPNLVANNYVVEFVAPNGYDHSPANQVDDDADSDANISTGLTAEIILTAGEDDDTVDAGFYQPASVSNFVWNDTNGNGIQDGGETGIDGITVRLLDPDNSDAVISSTVTSGGGLYSFTDLAPNNYVLEFVTPTGYSPSPANAGNDDVDSDASTSNGRTAEFTLAANESNEDFDAGFFQPASISDLVWDDYDGDGVKDAGEPGLDGVTVNLRDPNNSNALITTDVTALGGLYSFGNLDPGDYIVEFVLPNNYVASPQNASSGTAATDSDADPATGLTATINLTSGEDDDSIDAGFYQPASISNFVWYDLNSNGVQDASEPGLDGVTVRLLDTSDNELATTTTVDGVYSFTNLGAGDYVIDFVNPGTDWLASPLMIGTDTAVDSDADTTTGETATISLGIAENNDSIDAGFYRPAIISNRVWNDLDADGVQETGEPGIANVTVKLYDSLDLINELSTTTTDANGIYFFDDLEVGNYVVEFVNPGTGWDASPQSAGSDTTIDSDAHITTGFTSTITLAAGDTNDTIDAGFFLPPSIGDFVWADYNNNGIQDNGEPGIDGVTVRLLNASTLAEVASTTTVTNSEGSGFYIFQGFPAANYIVEFVKPNGYNAVAQSAGGDTALDSDAAPTTGRTGTINATAGAMILDVDAGFFPPATISNFVWDDVDGDGIQDGSETGIDGVIVRLIDPSDNSVITTDTTTGGGFYEFTDLLEGDYIVEFVTPTNYIVSPQTSGLDDTVDSNIDTATARTGTISLTPGETNDTIDAGFYQPGTISDYVWNDLDADGVQDGGEPPLGNVTVRLLDAFNGNAVLETTTSHPTTGLYSFTNLGAATNRYIVEFVAPSGFTGSPVDQGGNDALDSDASTANGRTSTITLNAGQTIDSVDAGFFEPATIGDYVWTDTNGDGVQDGSESGLDGVTVRLLHPTTFAVISTTTTSGGGAYSFTNVPAGSYVVEFVTPSGLTGSPHDNSSTTDALDSDADPTSGRTSTITVAAGDTIDTIDAGFFSPGTIGNFVWEDTNGNGVQDLNEDGLDGITVNLLNPNNSFAVLETTTTASGGLYSFEDLNANDYVVEFVLPSGFARSPQANGGTSATDSDADTDTGRTNTITLAAGGTNEDIDAGLYQPATISDRVWNDLDADGIQDLGETAGIGGTQVNLYDGSNSLVDTVFTDSSGAYSFTGLAPGDYRVEFIPPSGYVISPQDTSGSTEARDSDANPSTYLTDTITLTSGDDIDTVDVGMSLPAVIGNYVWVDENADGVQDAGEPGIPGVTVQLYDATGSTLLQTTRTDANGGYLFKRLVAGKYVVRVNTSSLSSSLAPNPTYDEDNGTSSPDSQTAVSVSPGEEYLSADFGYNHASVVETNAPDTTKTPLGAIGDRIWSDDGDGIQEPGEPGIPNVTVLLLADTNGDGVYGGTGDLGQAVLTDASGNYIFDGLEPGAYRVQVSTASLPAGFATPPTGDPDEDGDNISDPIVIAPGDVFLNADFGYNNPSSLTLGDKIYLDRDGDGTFDNGEPGIARVTVALIVGTDVRATTTTDDLGNYLFTGLPSGLDYTIRVTDTEHVLGSLVQTGDPDTPSSPNGQSTVTNLSASNLDQDFGYTPPAHGVGDGLIGDTVFLDLDNDGNVDAGEGLEGVIVYLDSDGNGSRGTNERYVVTDENGHYYFGGLETAGTYTVAVDTSALPGGLTNTVDPDTIGSGDHRSSVTLTAGGTDLDQDFGYVATIPNAISGTIWEDSDANGSLNESGMGIAGVTVDLYKDGQLVGTTSTDSNGGYSFSGLPEGSYVVDVTDTANLLNGYWHSEGPSPGTDGNSQTDTYSINKLSGGTTNPTADFGYYVKGAALGDFVWEDVNSDGEQNESGTGIANASVTLGITYPNGSAITLVTETDGSGNYSFGNLLLDEDYRTATAGDNADPNYTITFTTPPGLTPTHPGAGTAETDSNGTTESSITLEQGETDDTIDSGFVAPGSLASIGDLVWNDVNADGIKDGAESGLVGVTVNLYDDNGTLVDTDVTDSSGAYFFGSLLAGDYTVEFVPPSGYLLSPRDVGAESTDSDANPTTFRTAPISLVASENEDEVDAGMYAPATIGNYVWVDENGDGLQDAGEPGIPGVTVDLYDGTTLVATTTTDALGGYLITGIPAGTYEVRIDSATLPTGLAANPTYNEDTGTAAPDHVSAVTVGAGATHLTADFGYNYASVADTDTPSTSATGAIGDRIWNDTDQDGIQDPGESGIEGVTVRLLVDTNGDGVYGGTSGEILATTTTDASGNYIFDGLDEGAYVVEVVASSLPTGFSATPTGDPDGDGDNTSNPQVLAPGDVILTADFGYHLPTGLTIGDTVYLDEDGDGTFDSGELGIAGVTLALLENGEVIATTITDTNGNYNFGGLPSGLTYTVMVTDTSDVLGSWVQNGDPDTPLAPDGQSTVAALSGNNLDQDFGYVPAGHGTGEGLIGDTVFLDLNGNGTLDTGEGIAGVRLYLDLNHDGSLDADEPSTITNENGTYAFGGLNPTGTYTVAVDSTTIDSGLTNTVDPDGGLANQSNVTLSVIDLDQDFGYAAATPNSITGTVWTDTNADGVLLESNAGVPGITVALYSDPNGDGDPSDGVVIGMVTTDSQGNYTFGGLPDGDYIVDVTDTANLLEGYAHSIGPNAGDGTTDNQSQTDTYSITGLMGGTTDSTGDFGYYRDGAAIGNFVWDDTNSDGIQNESGTGFVGSLATLTITYPNGDTVDVTTLTTAGGAYAFGNLLADEDYRTATAGSNADPSYTVTFSNPSGGFVPTQTGQGTTATDSNGSSESDITLAQGQTDDTIDSGFVGPASQVALGDRVWLDLDGDGIQDAGETTGIEDVRVRLLDPNDNFSLVAETLTDSNGAYSFTGLAPDEYVVEFINPPRYQSSPQDSGAATEATDSDADTTTGRTGTLTLTAGQTNNDIDAGFFVPGAIGDRVWIDENADGIQDAGEPGVPTATVNLYDSSGTTLISTTTTDAEGRYLFTGVPAASYVVRVDTSSLPSGLAANQTFDPDSTSNHETLVSLSAGGEVLTADFGYNWSSTADTDTPPLSTSVGAIGDRVWLDADGDGLQDTGEAGLDNVTVRLLVDSNGDGVYGGAGDTAAVTTMTDAYGSYIFDDLAPGAYVVEVDNSTVPTGATQTGDPDGTKDHRTTLPILLGPGDTYLNADFGYQPTTTYTIGDTIYIDSNADGVQDVNERLVPGVTVVLLSGGEVVATTTTSALGDYTFTGVLPGTYTVWVSDTTDMLNGLVQTADPDATLDRQSTVTIVAANNQDQDFGFAPANHLPDDGYIGDTIFFDFNNNDTLDPAEGLEGVTVNLYDASGTVLLATTVTDAMGGYGFGGLDATATYVVSVDTMTLPNKGFGLTNNVDPDTASPGDSTSSINLAAVGGLSLDQDFGYSANIGNTLSGTLWHDTDGEGDLDESGEGLEFVTVDLFDDLGNLLAVALTDSNGNYSFGGLPDGTYVVAVSDRDNALEGYWSTIGASPGVDNNSQSRPYTVELDEDGIVNSPFTDTTADFGYFKRLSSIGDTVWEDTDGDGTQDEVGSGIAGAVVTLTIDYPNGDQVIATAVSDSNGNYAFGNLLADEDFTTATSASTDPNYTLTFITPATYVPTQLGQGTVATDSNNSPAAVTLAQGETDTTYDRGYVAPAAQATIGNLVWTDTDGDGIKDGNESGQSGITIRLMNPGPNGSPGGGDDIEIATTTSGPGGSYSFTTSPGNYFLEFDAPIGSNGFTQLDQGGNDATDSDVDPSIGQTAVTTLTAGENDDSVDAGLILTKPNNFAAWQADNPLGGNNGAADNPDGDLYDNLLEYALCLHPGTGIPNHDGFCVEHNAGQFDAVFRRATGGLTDLTYTIQGRSTLPVTGDTSWTTIATIPGQGAGASGATITDLGNGSEEVRLLNLQSTSPLSTTAGFVRLLVTKGADSSVTLVQGWLETLHKTNQCATYSVPLLKKEALSGAIESVVFNSLMVGGTTDLSTILDLANNSYYLEIIEGDHEGHRFDITGAGNGSLTLSADGNLCAGPPFNTLTSLEPTLAGDRFIVRAHYTIDELFPPTAPFVAGATASVADRLLFYSDSWDIYYLDSEANPDVWQLDGEAFADYGGTLVPPNQGLFLHPRTTDVTLLNVGVVRENDFALPLNPNYTLIPSVYPVDQSPTNRALVTTYGTYAIDGGFDPAKSDQISIWDGDSDGAYVEGYSAYFHLQGAGGAGFPDGWRDSSDAVLTPHAGTKLFKRNRSAFLLRRSSNCDTTYIMPQPWTPAQ